jgi:tetratricopeptide (TPR) repeat protein
MSDPQPTDPLNASGPTGDSDREARIEQLLLTGLDHYFAGHYEQAINVWTRVVFLERHHDRARAYIERARSAQAERQREAEELLHNGVAAYDAGETDKARDLLTRAVAEGSDTAHVFLDRLDRMGGSAVLTEPRSDTLPVRPLLAAARTSIPSRTGWIAASIGAVVVAAAMLVGGLPIGTWLSELQGSPETSVQPPPADPLPLIRTSETILARARTLYADGHLHDALRALDRIDVADPFRADADRLRADIQRSLLATAGPNP